MCGIAGFCNMPNQWEKNITRMNNRMIHRGPDATGFWANEDASVVLGHRRLSIVDLSETGSQPMISRSGRYVIAFNGEIYNYHEIIKKFEKDMLVKTFRGSSDTEVLLEAFEEYGIEDTIAICKGMFAIALYDRKEKQLFLIRDRIGEKPLYYGFIEGKFIFASDIAVIKENSNFHNMINKDALNLYLRYGYYPAPYTVYENIYKLDAGKILKISEPFNKYEITTYWDIKNIALSGQENRFKGTKEDAAIELERLLMEAIKGQMVADVPVGAFLSGGVDSSTIVALMQSLNSNKIKTFSIGFFNDKFNEAIYAKEIARHLGTDHTELYITDKDAINTIPKMAHIYGEPFGDSSQIPMYLVSQLAKKDVTVSLSGDGGDELFCGYNSYQKETNIWRKIHNLPYTFRKCTSALIEKTPLVNINQLALIGHYVGAKSLEHMHELVSNPRFYIDDLCLKRTTPSYKYNEYKKGFLKNQKENLMLMDMLMYHPDDILVKVDRAGMAVSLETRIPLLDKDIVEFAWRLPNHYKYEDGITKKVLRDVLYKYVPKSLIERPKKGFSIPVATWVKNGELRDWAEELLNESRIKNQGILNPTAVSKMWNDFIDNDRWISHIWYLLMFQEWYEEVV
jgi:asparagine synthase (glutamine-hydrolysing)